MSVLFKYLGILTLISFFLSSAPKPIDFIELSNSSFEDEPQDATVPTGWEPCGFFSTPDILPGFWGVELEPSDGDSYIGMIVRENGTNEYIGQKLTTTLKKGQCYEMSLDFAYDPLYAGFSEPLVVNVYASTLKCYREQKLHTTKAIVNKDWETVTFYFTPEKNFKHFVIEAKQPIKETSVKGNVLIDNISVIKKCDKA